LPTPHQPGTSGDSPSSIIFGSAMFQWARSSSQGAISAAPPSFGAPKILPPSSLLTTVECLF